MHLRRTVERRLVELVLELRLPDRRVVPSARAWVDLEPSGNLCSETEVQLELRRHWMWCGTFLVGRGSPSSGFFYRLGLRAATGAEWSLRVHDRTLRRNLLEDSDTLAMSKCWLVGSCPLAASMTENSRRHSLLPERVAGEAGVVVLAHYRTRAKTDSCVTSQENGRGASATPEHSSGLSAARAPMDPFGSNC
jgi:hypothetical protein